MPIDNNKPPDPLIQDFCELTGMSSANISHTVLEAPTSKGREGKPRRHRHGIKIKVSTPGSASAGAGSILRNLHSSRLAGKSRKRTNSSPSDVRGGKRTTSGHMSDEISKVLCDLESGAINPNLKFALGSSSDNTPSIKRVDAHSNDGSFIKLPLDKNPLDSNQKVPVAKSSGLEPGYDLSSVGDLGNTSNGQASSRDGIAIAKTGNSVDMAGSHQGCEHTHMEGVVNMGAVSSSDVNGIASSNGVSDFEFGKSDKTKGILKKPIGSLFKVQFGMNTLNNPFVNKNVGTNGNAWKPNGSKGVGSYLLANQFTADVDRFAEKLKQGSEELALKMEFTPNAVSRMDNGNRRIQFSAEEVYKGGQSCSLQLYGYFIGTSMDYRVTEPSSIPIWDSVYIIPMELCNGNGIGKIMSGVGKPMIMDKMTRERCLKKAGKLDFARVLVEVNANEDLPSVLEIEYPPLGNRPARVGKLDVKYQWKPPLCTHCKTFGHSTLACKVRPRTIEEEAVKNASVNNKVGMDSKSNDKGKSKVDDGFVTVGRNNKPVVSANASNDGLHNRNHQSKNGQYSVTRGINNKQSTSNGGYGKGGNMRNSIGFTQTRTQPKVKGNSGGVRMAKHRGNVYGNNLGDKEKSGNKPSKSQYKPASRPQSLQELSKDPNFKPKVLFRGSSSKNSSESAINESIPLNNSYQALKDVDMEQCIVEKNVAEKDDFLNSVWPGLKEEVDILF
ncbi:hypothetical protein CTI12_AA240690 [Artemisia annua]|uniref:DUF4283 domain-containing protein n=1 Tax=Artemisia annua TaxID=35608 RepID=A0A2U1NQQ8_ARTAN|nr:hypothetical protein CTI12_AA240690 [Artemisia annua]